MDKTQKSIFENYYHPAPFVDHYTDCPEGAVDVIIPVIHTNELWESNLISIYREVPVHRLLIGDGGCTDDTITKVKEFPRVEVFDHRSFTSLGFSIRKLIEAVETDWFVYLHSDVYLPPNWFEEMRTHQEEYDWFECRQRITALIEYEFEKINRALSGAQMGRAKTLQEVSSKIDDDFLYRNEDMILAGLIKENGYKYGQLEDVFHYHQVMYKQSAWLRKIKSIQFEVELGREEEARANMMQIKGLVKYLDPDDTYLQGIVVSLDRLQEMGELSESDFLKWVEDTKPAWRPLIAKEITRNKLRKIFRRVGQKVKKIIDKV